MASAEERLQQMIGAYAFQVASLLTQLEQSQARVKDLEAAQDADNRAMTNHGKD